MLNKNFHPLVEFLRNAMKEQNWTLIKLASESGVCASTISHWQVGSSPNLINIEACLNALGYDIKPFKK